MAERIDHVAEALEDIRYADEVLAEGSDYGVADAISSVAQVHATLALVEQQRIANLIAYASHRIDHTNALGPAILAPTLRDLLGGIDFAIREGLGL